LTADRSSDYKGLGAGGLEPPETEVEGFTVCQNPTSTNARQYLST